MDITEIRDHYTAKALEEIAHQLPKEQAAKMYETMEAIARLLVVKVAESTALADPECKDLATRSMNEADVWANYLAEQNVRYQ